MLKIVFFARIKEELACAELQLEWDESLSSVSAVQEYLCSRNDGQWRLILGEDNIICAINHTVMPGNARVCDNDEVAFFPPVTGG